MDYKNRKFLAGITIFLLIVTIIIRSQEESPSSIHLHYSTIFGNKGQEVVNGLAVDSQGNFIIVGHTTDPNFPVKDGYDMTFMGLGGHDGFVSKFSSAGKLIWSSFVSGEDGFTYGRNVVVDSNDEIIIVGETSGTLLPTTDGLNQSNSGSQDGIVLKFSSSGSLVWSTYLGGKGFDYCHDVVVDLNDNIFVVGDTSSNDFPGIIDPLNEPVSQEAYITKLNSSGHVLRTQIIGGDYRELGRAIKIDNDENYIVVGETSSENFPVLNAHDDSIASSSHPDLFISKFNSSGSLQWSSYFGGNDYDIPRDVFIDRFNDVYVTGWTQSNDFETTPSASDTTFNTGDNEADAFLSKFSSEGALVWSTFLGGTDLDLGEAITVYDDTLYVIGTTASSDFPKRKAFDSSLSGTTDVFITEFSYDGKMIESSFFGGSGSDLSADAIVHDNKMYIAGATEAGFPIVNAADTYKDGGMFISIFSDDPLDDEGILGISGYALVFLMAVALIPMIRMRRKEL